jgi:hypothetical protein
MARIESARTLVVVALGNSRALMSQKHAHALDRYDGEKQFHSERVA